MGMEAGDKFTSDSESKDAMFWVGYRAVSTKVDRRALVAAMKRKIQMCRNDATLKPYWQQEIILIATFT